MKESAAEGAAITETGTSLFPVKQKTKLPEASALSFNPGTAGAPSFRCGQENVETQTQTQEREETLHDQRFDLKSRQVHHSHKHIRRRLSILLEADAAQAQGKCPDAAGRQLRRGAVTALAKTYKLSDWRTDCVQALNLSFPLKYPTIRTKLDSIRELF